MKLARRTKFFTITAVALLVPTTCFVLQTGWYYGEICRVCFQMRSGQEYLGIQVTERQTSRPLHATAVAIRGECRTHDWVFVQGNPVPISMQRGCAYNHEGHSIYELAGSETIVRFMEMLNQTETAMTQRRWLSWVSYPERWATQWINISLLQTGINDVDEATFAAWFSGNEAGIRQYIQMVTDDDSLFPDDWRRAIADNRLYKPQGGGTARE